MTLPRLFVHIKLQWMQRKVLTGRKQRHFGQRSSSYQDRISVRRDRSRLVSHSEAPCITHILGNKLKLPHRRIQMFFINSLISSCTNSGSFFKPIACDMYPLSNIPQTKTQSTLFLPNLSPQTKITTLLAQSSNQLWAEAKIIYVPIDIYNRPRSKFTIANDNIST